MSGPFHIDRICAFDLFGHQSPRFSMYVKIFVNIYIFMYVYIYIHHKNDPSVHTYAIHGDIHPPPPKMTPLNQP